MNAVGLRDHFLTNAAADTAGICSDTFLRSVGLYRNYAVIPKARCFTNMSTSGIITVSITCIGIAMTGINT